MDKNTFLRELRSALHVLQEDELEDIINEYEQHIDMKMKNGQTEDEAIADFGSLSELTADILEAYHVRSDYVAGKKKEKKSAFGEMDAAKAGKEILQQTGRTCKGVGEKVAHGLRSLGSWLWNLLLLGKTQLFRPVRWVGRKWKSFREKDGTQEKTTLVSRIPRRERNDHSPKYPDYPGNPGNVEYPGNAAGRICRGITSMFRKMVWLMGRCLYLGLGICLWGIRMAWNAFWIGFAILSGGLGLCCLFVFGMLAVLWMQRYPLAGLTIGCLGLVLCMFSAAGFAVTLIWRKRRKQKADADEPLHGGRKGPGESIGQRQDLVRMDGEQHA